MLRTNLSTRPFYNVRLVRFALGAFAVIVIAITLINIIQVVRLSSSQRSLGARAAQAEAEAVRLRAEATRINAQIDPKELAVVAAAAQEANEIIDRRTFSWSSLWQHLEATLPENVRIRAVRPRLDRRAGFVVGMNVEARQVEDLEAFLEALEKTGVFHNVLSVEEQTSQDELIEAIVEGTYTPQAPATDGATSSGSNPAGGGAGD